MSVFDQSRLLQRLKEQGYSFEVVFDVGASIGRWTREVQTVFPDARFELFEPLAGRVPEVDNASLVGQLMHATLHPVALSDRTGQGEIKFLAANGVGSSILILEGDR
jgi:FkbM family methyltransferase